MDHSVVIAKDYTFGKHKDSTEIKKPTRFLKTHCCIPFLLWVD